MTSPAISFENNEDPYRIRTELYKQKHFICAYTFHTVVYAGRHLIWKSCHIKSMSIAVSCMDLNTLRFIPCCLSRKELEMSRTSGRSDDDRFVYDIRTLRGVETHDIEFVFSTCIKCCDSKMFHGV